MVQDYWKYSQSQGTLFSPSGKKAGRGYSGRDAGLNNPALQSSVNIGPIPQGWWLIDSHPQGPSHMGPLALALTPINGTTTFGRGGFFIHGDTEEDVIYHTCNASHGCLVFSRPLREALLASPVKQLFVVESDDSPV